MVAFFSYVGGEYLNSEVYISKSNETSNHQKNHRQQAMVSVFLWLA